MTWLPLLLADPSPSLRLLVLCELMAKPADDPEVKELSQLRQIDPLITRLAALQSADGSWDPGRLPGSFPGGALQATALALMRLGFMGLDSNHPVVARAAAYLFSLQEADGCW